VTQNFSTIVETARDYYNSDDADNFYFHVWGGEDIHVGIYDSPTEPIADASRRTVQQMAQMLSRLGPEANIVDIGSGYGGSARWLAGEYGCRVSAVNLSEIENARGRQMVAAAGLDALVEIIDGNFEVLPFNDGVFDFAWSQDAILHSGRREIVLQEVSRVLKSGGEFIFTDPMQANDCPPGVLQPVLDRIHLDSLASIDFYREVAQRVGFEVVEVVEMTAHLICHYGRVREELLAQRDSLRGKVSDDYVERMLVGLQNWVDAGERGYLAWGILKFRKL
jgi:sarcosine/dimethylglycine N-methyltransferase